MLFIIFCIDFVFNQLTAFLTSNSYLKTLGWMFTYDYQESRIILTWKELLCCHWKLYLNTLTCGVLQGSILGPLLFNLHILLQLLKIITNNNISYHSYADLHPKIAISHNDNSPLESLCQWIDQINCWMSQNFLQLTQIDLKRKKPLSLNWLRSQF